MNKLLEETISQTQEKIIQIKEWSKTYEEQAKIMQEQKALLDQFYKGIKGYEYLQFYLVEVCTNAPTIFKVQARYKGQPVATVVITKDTTLITTEEYNESNKKVFKCKFKLDNINLDSVEAKQFLNYFNEDIAPNGEIDEQAHLESMLLAEFRQNYKQYKIIVRYSAN